MNFKDRVYEITEIGDKTYLIDEKTSTMFVLIGEERALVIDCGTGIGDFRSVVEKLVGSLPYDLAVTHTHVDHIGGRGQFEDMFVSAADSKYIKGVTPAMRKGYVFINAMTIGGSPFEKKLFYAKNEPRIHIMSEGDVFDLGSRHIKVFMTPGHTVGSASFLDIENRTIYIGDVANENLLMMLPHAATIDEMNETIRKIISIDGCDTVWASHHTEPFGREKLYEFLSGGEKIAQNKNTPVPLVKLQNDNGNKIVYRTNRIH